MVGVGLGRPRPPENDLTTRVVTRKENRAHHPPRRRRSSGRRDDHRSPGRAGRTLASPAAHSWHADSSHVAAAARSAKAKTSVSAPTEVKAGDDITIKATLKRKSGSTYKAYAEKKLELVLLEAPGAETGTVVDTAETSKKGKVTFVGSFDDTDLGDHDFLVAYEGGSKARASESDLLTITVTG